MKVIKITCSEIFDAFVMLYTVQMSGSSYNNEPCLCAYYTTNYINVQRHSWVAHSPHPTFYDCMITPAYGL